MNDTPRLAARKSARIPLIASLAVLLSVGVTLATRPHAKAAHHDVAKPAAQAVATTPDPGPDNTNEGMGCGDSESCYAMP